MLLSKYAIMEKINLVRSQRKPWSTVMGTPHRSLPLIFFDSIIVHWRYMQARLLSCPVYATNGMATGLYITTFHMDKQAGLCLLFHVFGSLTVHLVWSLLVALVSSRCVCQGLCSFQVSVWSRIQAVCVSSALWLLPVCTPGVVPFYCDAVYCNESAVHRPVQLQRFHPYRHTYACCESGLFQQRHGHCGPSRCPILMPVTERDHGAAWFQTTSCRRRTASEVSCVCRQ